MLPWIITVTAVATTCGHQAVIFEHDNVGVPRSVQFYDASSKENTFTVYALSNTSITFNFDSSLFYESFGTSVSKVNKTCFCI